MTKGELLELLLVERHLPLPVRPARGLVVDETNAIVIPDDTRAIQYSRRSELLEELDAYEKNPGRKRATKDGDDTPTLVQRGGLWVADRSAA